MTLATYHVTLATYNPALLPQVNDAFALYVTNDHLLCGCSDGVVRVFEPASLTHIVNLPKPHPLGVDLASCTSPR